MVKTQLFGGIYKGKRVFITGHTGFKGSWLALWLHEMGAIVKGYALVPNTTPSHWDLLDLDVESVYADLRDRDRLRQEMVDFQPDIVFHLAAQPLVRDSYEIPFETYEINVMGTMAVYEACRACERVKAIVSITTDKCYENREWVWGYRENEAMGGYDPYSSSKGCVEIMSASYRRSFFNVNDYGTKHHVLLATVRAGNVIGGGDWAKDRLVPDIMKAAAKQQSVVIRNPKATRPWQHVLEPLSGYLLLGQHLLQGEMDKASAWNFGPDNDGNVSVGKVAAVMKEAWADVQIEVQVDENALHEANLLMLDCSKARRDLHWQPVWNNEGFQQTALWYKAYYKEKQIISKEQLDAYILKSQNN